MKSYKPVRGKGVTWGVAGMVFSGTILLLPIIFTFISGKVEPPFVIIMGLLFLGMVIMFGYFTWAAKNMEYVLEENELVIKWAFNKKSIPLDTITGIERAIGSSSLKVVGASWPGFHLGSFTSPTGKGSVNLFATRIWGEIILIRTKWEVIGITPEDAEGFLKELNEKLPELNSDRVTGSREETPISPWKDKRVIALVVLTFIILLATGIYLIQAVPGLPSRVPMHYNLTGEVDRYGAPNEIFYPFGIGVLVVLMMFGITGVTSRNNKSSVFMTALTGILISVIFSVISIGMVLSVK